MKNAIGKNIGSNVMKIAASAFLLLGLNVNPATAENVGHEGLATVYHIYTDGGYLGAVSENEKVEELVDRKIAETMEDFSELKLEPEKSFNVIAEQVFEPTVKDEQEILSQLDEKLEVKASAFALTLDGEIIAQLKDRAAYDETIRQVLLQYASSEELEQWEANKLKTGELPGLETDETRITSIDIVEDLAGVTAQAAPEEIMDAKEAASLLKDKGLTVIVEKQKKVEEGIEFETIEQEDGEMYVGKSEVGQEGKNGEKQVTYAITETDGKQTNRHTVTEEVITEPVEQVVLKGTKEIPTVGTGKFSWPAEGGYISSKLGPRWGSHHNGIDIARPDGFDILAADHGVVRASGPDGTFGNRVIIDHNNGYETIYAHLASIDVKVGDKVPQGMKIGVMGTTGRSTGIHLHFEVSKDGVTKNPLDYIEQ